MLYMGGYYGTAGHGTARHDTARHGTARHSNARQRPQARLWAYLLRYLLGLLCMPDWFRARAQWLHTLAYVSVKTIHLIPGGMSALFVKVMQCFWGPELNLQTLGVRLMRGTADASFVAKIKFGCFLSGEKADN